MSVVRTQLPNDVSDFHLRFRGDLLTKDNQGVQVILEFSKVWQIQHLQHCGYLVNILIWYDMKLFAQWAKLRNQCRRSAVHEKDKHLEHQIIKRAIWKSWKEEVPPVSNPSGNSSSGIPPSLFVTKAVMHPGVKIKLTILLTRCKYSVKFVKQIIR